MLRNLLLVGCLLVAVGCSGSDPAAPASATVSGTVTVNGTPLKSGLITFVPEKNDGFPSPSAPITDGSYSAKPRLGNSKVEIRSPQDTGKKNSTGGAIQEESLPPTYNAKTTLTANVTGDTRDLNFALKK